MDLLKSALANVQKTAQNFFQPPPQQVNHNPMSQPWTSGLVDFGSGVGNIANKVINTKFLPGQQQTIAQSFHNVINSPGHGILSNDLAAGRLQTGFKPLDLPGQVAGQYVQNKYVEPISQGIQSLQKPGIVNKGLGGLSLLQAQFNATPAGVGTNLLAGLGVSGIQAFRNGTGSPQQFLQNAINNQTGNVDIAGTGLGIKNPVTALAIDTLLTRSPKNIIEDPLLLKAGKNILTNTFPGMNKAVNQYQYMNPQDQAKVGKLVTDLIYQGKNPDFVINQKQNIEDQLRMYAEKYVGKDFAWGTTGKGSAKTFKTPLQDIAQELVNRLRGEQNMSDINLPQMGLVGKKQIKVSSPTDTNILPQTHNEGLSTQSQHIQETGGGIPKSSSGSSSGGSIAQVPNSESPYFNTNKLNVSPEAKQQVNNVIREVKPQIEKVVGKKLSNQEIINTANSSAKVLHKVVDRSQTEEFTARLLKTRQQLAAAAESGTVDKSYIDNLMTIKSQATDIARKLQSFSIGADPKLITSKEAILSAVLDVEKNSDKVLKAAEGVDFNDLKQATDFYRQFVKPTKTEWLDLVRYNSMLSSPNTHINNAFSNLGNTAVVAPIEKTLTGTLDFLGSKITGKKQTQFAGEGAAYAKGYASSIHDAAHSFADVLKGKKITGNLDVRQIPLSTSKRVSNLNLPTRLLEASDQFFTTLTKGGEAAALNYRKAKGVNVGNIETKALDSAKYRLFRSELHREGQGTVLNAIDDFTGLIQKARNSENPVTSTIAKFTLPFVQTPMNILKQGVEYSPAGVLTIPGAANKTEQLSKAIIGSSAVAASALLITSGRTTWTEPTDPTKQAAFRAAGMQPYAVKIGNHWVAYSKLPPAVGFPLAFLSAIHDAEQNKLITENQFNVVMNAAAKYGNFFADQSYMKNIGDLVTAAKGSPEAMTRFVSNYPQQVVPYRALFGWMARLADPYQRKVNQDAGFLDKQVQQLFTQIPFASMTVPARTDKAGNPIPNQNAALNAFSPVKITTENPEQKAYYDSLQQKSQTTRNINAVKKAIQQGKDVTGLMQASAAEPQQTQKNALQNQAQDSITKEKIKLSGLVQTLSDGSIAYRNDKGNVSTINMTPPTKGQGIDQFTNENWKYSKAREVWKAPIDQKTKDAAFKKLGVDAGDVRYDYLASHSDDVKTQYILSKNMDHKTLLQRLLTGRVVSATGSLFASNGVLDNLYEQGAITNAEKNILKKAKYDKKGQPIQKAGTGSVKKPQFVPRRHLAAPKMPKTSIKLTSAPKMPVQNVKFNVPDLGVPQGLVHVPNFKAKIHFNV